MPTIISHYRFCKRKKITLFLIITFGMILFPNLFLIDHAIQIEKDNQIIEEIKISNDNEESFNKLTSCDYYDDIPSYFLISGLFIAASISLWTLGIIKYADKLRNTEIEKINNVTKKFLLDFLDNLFDHKSIFVGVILLTITNSLIHCCLRFGHFFNCLPLAVGVRHHYAGSNLSTRPS